MTEPDAGVRLVRRHRFDGHGWVDETAQAVDESPITLFVNGREYVTAAVTPIDLKDWVLGFLAGDGAIRHAADITVFQYRPDDGQIWVRVPGFQPRLSDSRYLGSCCGQSRPGFFNPQGVSPLPAGPVWEPEMLMRTFDELSAWSHSQNSGGLHAAGLCRDTDLLLARADVGRHNALDKVYGAALAASMDTTNTYVVFSGRLSAEIVWKVRQMNVAAIVSNAAPTSLGIELGEQLGVTLVGFLRNSAMSVYTHPERLSLPPL